MQFNERIRRILLYLIIIAIVIITLFPIYWAFLTSIRTKKEILSQPKLYPVEIYLENYIEPFLEGVYGRYLMNSLIIASLNVVLVLLVAIPATYALSRSKLYGAKHLFFWTITNRMAPPAVFLLPLFLMFALLHLLDTHLVLILVYCVFNLPFAVWLLKGIIDGIPKDLDDAALIDGCSIWGVLGRVIVPLAKPGIAVTALLTWLFAWNEYIFAMILTSVRARTITTGLAEFVTVVGIKWGEMAAVSMITMIPAFLLLTLVQRYIIAGLTFGAVKE